MKPVALQLYTVREAAAQDFPGTLKQVAEIGYKGVEFAGLHGYNAVEIRKIIDDLGIVTCSCHTGLPSPENVSEIVETQLALGSNRIATGIGESQLQTVDQCKAAAEHLALAAELIAPHGITLGYHNHWWEFHKVEDGRFAWEVLMQEAPAIFAELDTYWSSFGADTIDVINRYKSRIPLYHIKDGMLDRNLPQKPVGSGKLDFAAIIGAIDSDVTEWLIVENDDSDIDMMESAKLGYQYLTSHGLAAGNK